MVTVTCCAGPHAVSGRAESVDPLAMRDARDRRARL
jgi:hypothetical protein